MIDNVFAGNLNEDSKLVIHSRDAQRQGELAESAGSYRAAVTLYWENIVKHDRSCRTVKP